PCSPRKGLREPWRTQGEGIRHSTWQARQDTCRQCQGSLGGAIALKAKAGANAGTNGANFKDSLSLGLLNGKGHGAGGGPGGGNDGNDGNNGNNGGSNAGISREIAAPSASERRVLMRKCPTVLSSPARSGFATFLASLPGSENSQLR